jgi:hypothetical protein
MLRDAARQGAAHRVIPVRGEQRVKAIDVAQPDLRPPMRELRQIRERLGSQLQQMLALQIALGPFAGHRGDVLGAMLRQDRALAGLEFPLMRDLEAARHDPHAVAIEIQGAGDADGVRQHRVRMRVVDHLRGGADDDGHAQRPE